MKHKSNIRRGFTLIELLVVIAIIAILATILLPSLTRARELAKKVVCTSNMKNIGLATHMYSQSFDGTFPSVNGSTENYNTPDVWAMCVYVWATGGQDDVWMLAYPEIGNIKTEDRVLYPYIESGKIWKCPSDDSQNAFWSNLGAPRPEFYHVYGSSYAFNANCLGQDHTPDVTHGNEGLWGKKRADVVNPGKTVEYYEFNCFTTDIGIRAHDKEQLYCNFLISDGHVGYFLMESDSNVWLGGETGFTFKAN